MRAATAGKLPATNFNPRRSPTVYFHGDPLGDGPARKDRGAKSSIRDHLGAGTLFLAPNASADGSHGRQSRELASKCRRV
jgi:hypothetical protein